jgi:L-iditol 2-dehydrogenase
VVIEAVGKPETWEIAVRVVRKGGTVNFFGGCPQEPPLPSDTSLIHYSNLAAAGQLSSYPQTFVGRLDSSRAKQCALLIL